MRGLTTGAFADIAHAGKVKILEGPLHADVGRLSRLLQPLAGEGGSATSLESGIVQFIAALPVYRTYVDGQSPAPHADDVAVVDRAVDRARAGGGAVPMVQVERIRDLVLGRSEATATKANERLLFVQRLQQTSGPATAKGIEDTALYQYVPLASRNEVGGAPDRSLQDTVGRLHRANSDRACAWPSALTCTNTHDTKRSADVRARLDVLSERPAEWQQSVERWRGLNQRHRTTVKGEPAPDVNTEYLLYQTLIGMWPSSAPTGRPDELPDRAWLDSARERLEQYMLKAVKEAKTQTSWTEPNEAYENALKQFIAGILGGADGDPFLCEVARLTTSIARLGHWNALSRVLLHLTAPGVPDTYQGDELWFFALVDPDNRRPVDYKKREELLATSNASLHELHPADDRMKLGMLRRLLHARRRSTALFKGGAYVPVEIRGDRAKHLMAFARRTDSEHAVVIAPRLLGSISSAERPEPDWGNTEIVIPNELRGRNMVSVFHDRELSLPNDGVVKADRLLDHLPLSLLLSP
jgi:(1->4)-alpha-D-glucan 1-alpha-D-glucosylmutase